MDEDINLTIRSNVFILYCAYELIAALKMKHGEARDQFKYEINSKLKNRDHILLNNIYVSFSNYFEVYESRSQYEDLLDLVDIVIIGYTIVILEYYLGKAYFDHAGFYTAHGPLGIFKRYITGSKIDEYIEACIKNNFKPLKDIKAWVDGNFTYYRMNEYDLTDKMRELGRTITELGF